MVFHSATFGLFVLAAFLAFWLLSPWRRARTLLLLLGSYTFYASWHPYYLGLIAFSTVLDYVCGQALDKSDVVRTRKLILTVSLVGNLAVMCFFKYYDWFVESIHVLLGSWGVEVPLHTLGLVIPVGISFYTFQTMSYTLDIYRGVLKPTRSLLDFAVFVSFFPQLVAGPIVRAVEFLPQMELPPRFDRERLHDGLFRIAQGLAKKVLLADMIGRYLVDPVYASPETYTGFVHLIAVYGFFFQIYNDFSGYSDIAIGTARLFGFDLPENFRTPLRSRSVREFWRRWHMTLSFWVRDYVYFPLGGSRRPPLRVAFNLVFTMVLLGLWHGASVLWILYGLVNGLAMSFERLLGGALEPNTPAPAWKRALGFVYAFHFMAFAFMLVRSSDMPDGLGTMSDMFTRVGDVGSMAPLGLLTMGLAALAHFVPDRAAIWTHRRVLALPTPVVGVLFGIVTGLVSVGVVGETPYIYFQF